MFLLFIAFYFVIFIEHMIASENTAWGSGKLVCIYAYNT